jgi:hypothetical protein
LHTLSFFSFPGDAVEVSDERDANETTDSSSSDFTRVRNPFAIDDVASTIAGARNTLSGLSAVLFELLVVLL